MAVWLITGASRGLGSAIARAALAEDTPSLRAHETSPLPQPSCRTVMRSP